MEYRDDDSFDIEDLENEANEKERLEQEKIERERLERERLEQERLERERIERERLERERLEKERFEQLKMESKVYPNYTLFMIPSWSDLLGYPTLGTYVNHPVSRIEADPVIFFSSYDYSIETPKGTLHYLFGLGYHFLKFELESGKYVTDNRVLTGLVLSDFVYDLMATSTNVTLEEDREVVIAEKVIKVPVDLSDKPEDHLTFIKGALMRNVFIPNKAIFLEMMERISTDNSYDVSSEGHKILSGNKDFFNQILVSEKMNPNSSFLNPTAGLEGIHVAADNLLGETISSINLEIIEESINVLKQVYSNLEYDPMSLFSILEHVAPLLSSVASRTFSAQVTTQSKGTVKNSIFISAEDRLFEFSNWPAEFVRKAKLEPKPLPQLVEEPSIMTESLDHVDLKDSDFRTVNAREMEQEEFELDTLKSETVEYKPLPPSPEADIKKILLYLKKVIEEDYEMRSIGQAFELAREIARQMGVSASTLHQKKIWEMSKYANIYIKKDSGLGLPEKEKADLIRKVNEWQFEIEERERLERERLEQIEREKQEALRLERERIERERLEREKQERERLERIRLEKERLAQEQLEQERLEQIEREKQEALRLERERLEKIEREKEEELRLERERVEREREELEAIEREKQELKRLKQERKQKEKEAKKEAKKRKKLEKQKKKLEKKRLKEEKKLKNL